MLNEEGTNPKFAALAQPAAYSAMTAAEQLDAMLADIARAVEDARAYQQTHGLTTTATRKLPGVLLHTLERWRQRMREAPPHTDLQ